MTRPAPSLFLLEFAEDVELLKERGLTSEDAVAVCLAPAPVSRLDEEKLNFRYVHEFVSSARIQEELDGNWDRLEQIMRSIDEHVPYGWTAAMPLRVLIDTCMEKIIHLVSTIGSVNPARIVFVGSRELSFDFTLAFAEHESVYSRLLPPICRSQYAGIELVRVEPAPRPTSSSRSRLSVNRLKSVLRPRYRAVRSRLGSITQKGSREGRLCVGESGHGMGRAASRTGSSCSVWYWEPLSAYSLPPDSGLNSVARLLQIRKDLVGWRQRCSKEWESWHKKPVVQDLFRHRGVPFFDVVETRLRYLFTNVFPDLFVIERNGRDFFRRQSVRCFASNFFSRPTTYALAMAARAEGVPVATMQHSAYGYWDWRLIKYADAVMSDYKFVGGVAVAEYVEEVENAGCQPVVTGMPSFDALVGKVQPKKVPGPKPRVVYALASYVKNFIHYTHSRMAVTEYFNLNCSIMRVLGNHPEVDVEVRPHPAERFQEHVLALEQWLKDRNWRHVSITASGTTLQAMQRADLIVIDSPSTVLLHAATTNAQIMVINKTLAIPDKGAEGVRRRATYFTDLLQFLDSLEEVLSSRAFEVPQHHDDSFLRDYATHLHDGLSTRRVRLALEALAQGHEPASATGDHR